TSVLLVWLCIVASGGTLQAATLVQVNAATPQTPQTSVAATYLQAQAAGNTNILAIGWTDATSNIVSIQDAMGNTYRRGVATARGTGLSQAVYYASNVKAAGAGANTITVTLSAAPPSLDLRITEYSGLDPKAPFDTGHSAWGTKALADSGNIATKGTS